MAAVRFAGVFALAMACGGNSSGVPDTGVPDDAGAMDEPMDMDAADPDTGVPVPALFPAPPQVVTSGGPTAAMGKVVPIFWSNDPIQSDIEAYLKAMSPSPYWSATTKEYKVGDYTLAPSVVITAAPFTTIDDSGIQTFLATHADGSDAAWPTADPSTVFVVAFPATTTITLQSSQLCNGIGGYHSESTLANSTRFSYAVIPRCSGLDSFTATTSHELTEWATDPYPFSSRAFSRVDTAHLYWENQGLGSEVGDMCETQSNAYARILGNFVVQRTWSNASIKAGHDPCVPPPANTVYFAAAPDMPDSVLYTYFNQKIKVPGVQIPVGMSKTIDVHLYSDGPVAAPWTVSASTSQSALGSLTFMFDTNKGQNGDILHLTITSVKATSTGTARFNVTSTNKQNVRHSWYGLVGF